MLTKPVMMVDKQPLSPPVMRLRLETDHHLDYRVGQYITLWRDGTTGRSGSLASLPGKDSRLELHVARIDGGMLSTWIHDDLQVGDSLDIQGAMGDCFYLPGNGEQPLLPVGIGTGLAPLYGIVRDALRNGHSGAIHLFHGARNSDYLYCHAELTELSTKYDNLHYHPSLLQTEAPTPKGMKLWAPSINWSASSYRNCPAGVST